MTAWRQAIELSIGAEDLARLVSIAQSRTEPAGRVERALAYGPMAALDDRPRSGKEPTITAEAKAWLVSLACRKAKELGYPHELWTTRLLARHAREHGPAEGHGCLAYHRTRRMRVPPHARAVSEVAVSRSVILAVVPQTRPCRDEGEASWRSSQPRC